MMESKRVEFQFEVEGMQDLDLEEEKSLNATVEEFKEQSKMVKKKVPLPSTSSTLYTGTPGMTRSASISPG